MRQISWALVATLGTVGVTVADEPRDRGAPHGGTVVKAKSHQFEVISAPSGVRVYPLTPDNKPVDTSKLTGTATFYHPSAPGKPWFTRPLRAAGERPGQVPTMLDVAIDLGRAPARGVTVSFQVAGFSDASEPSASFVVPFALPTSGALSVAMATAGDQVAINALRVCPVSRKGLGSMGTPLKITRGDKATFICCKGCLKEIQAHPDRYLGASDTAASR